MFNAASTYLSVLLAQENIKSWWEPGTPNFLDVGDMSAVLAFTLAVLGALNVIIKRSTSALRNMIREEISVATEPIHPNSNGGLSLPDVARRTAHLASKIDEIVDLQEKNNKLYVKVLEKVFELENEIETCDDKKD